MKLSTAQNLPARDRMYGHLTPIAWGAAAERELLATNGGELHTVVLLPIHTMIMAETNAGLRPAAVHLGWDSGNVVAVAAGTSRTASWTVKEHGVVTTGSTTFTANDSGELTVSGYPSGAAAHLTQTAIGKAGLERLSRTLIKQASTAEWTFTHELERFVMFSLEAANRSVAREIDGTSYDENAGSFTYRESRGSVDRFTLDKLAGELLYGTTGTSSIIRRLIVRCATTDMNQVPLAFYLARNISQPAVTAIRRDIGDPRIGPAVRQYMRENNPESIADLLSGFRSENPNAKLGLARAAAALTAGRTLDSKSESIHALLIA